jgi:hypothetical protein
MIILCGILLLGPHPTARGRNDLIEWKDDGHGEQNGALQTNWIVNYFVNQYTLNSMSAPERYTKTAVGMSRAYFSAGGVLALGIGAALLYFGPQEGLIAGVCFLIFGGGSVACAFIRSGNHVADKARESVDIWTL